MSEEDDRYADWLKDIKRLSGMPVKNEPKPEEYKAPETPDTPQQMVNQPATKCRQ